MRLWIFRKNLVFFSQNFRFILSRNFRFIFSLNFCIIFPRNFSIFFAKFSHYFFAFFRETDWSEISHFSRVNEMRKQSEMVAKKKIFAKRFFLFAGNPNYNQMLQTAILNGQNSMLFTKQKRKCIFCISNIGYIFFEVLKIQRVEYFG